MSTKGSPEGERGCAQRAGTPVKALQRAFALGLLTATLAGCGSSGGMQGLDAYVERDGGLVARLHSRSSAITGTARAFDYRDGVQVQLAASNLIPGTYRLVLHERGNCTSPNLYSAGPAWAPPGWTKPAGELLPSFFVGEEGTVVGYVVFIKGVGTSGPNSIRGRSFVLHSGSLVGEAFPGQPNNRMACGEIVEGKALF